MGRKGWIISICIIIVIAAMIGIFFYLRLPEIKSPSPINEGGAVVPTSSNSLTQPNSSAAGDCLLSDQYAIESPGGSSTEEIEIKSKTTGDIISTFSLPNVAYLEYHSIEIHPCDVYVMEEFGQDKNNSFPPGYSNQLWRYDYNGSGEKLFTLLGISPNGTEEAFYDTDFRVSSDEKYLALEAYPNQASDSVVIYNSNTLNALFTVSLADIIAKYPNLQGMVEFQSGGWSSEGDDLWFALSNEADVYGFVRVNPKDQIYQVFPAPQITMGGDAFNPDTGMVTYRTNAAPWTGDAEIDQEYQQQAAQSGQVTSFNIEDLLTGKIYVVATTTDPTYYYQPKWISDKVLQYTLPSGATSTYVVF
jgi:hypothetical protein